MATSDFDDLEDLRRLVGTFQKAVNGAGADGQDSSASFFKALLSFFSLLLGGDPNAQQFNGPDNTDGRQGDFRKSVTDYFPSHIRDVPETLSNLRNTHAGESVILPVLCDVHITTEFGERETVKLPNGKTVTTDHHQGVDIAPAIPGSHPDIVAPVSGVVVGAGWINGYGNTVDILDTNGTRHRFGHLQSFDVKEGQKVDQGEKIAVMGMTGDATGVHLHYEQRDANGKPVDPIIMDRTVTKGDHITSAQSQAFLAMQQQRTPSAPVAENTAPASNHPYLDALLAAVGLPATVQSSGYAPPVAAGGKPAPQPGQGVGS